MLSRRHLLTSAAALALSGALAPAMQAQEGGPPPPPANAVLKGAVAVTRVFGDGPRLIAVALAYDRPIAANSVGLAGFAVAGRTVTRAYAALSSAPTPVPADGTLSSSNFPKTMTPHGWWRNTGWTPRGFTRPASPAAARPPSWRW